jgi:hypothetical protein
MLGAAWCLGTVLLLAVAVAGGSLLDWLAAGAAVVGVAIFWLLIRDEARRRS